MHTILPHKKAFTLVELIVNIGVIAMLAAILLPAFAKVRETAHKTSCAGNLRQLSLGILQYTQDYDDHLPFYTDSYSSVWLPARLAPYVGSTQIWKCPSSQWEADAWDGTARDWSVSYGINFQVGGEGGVKSLASIPKAAETVLLCENGENNSGVAAVDPLAAGMGRPLARHNGLVNVSFVDGHTKAFKLAELQKTAATEDGTPLYGVSSSVLWNTF